MNQIVWVLTIKTTDKSNHMSAVGAYSTAKKAKEAACYHLGLENNGIDWTPTYTEGEGLSGYTIWDGKFEGEAKIDAIVLDEMY